MDSENSYNKTDSVDNFDNVDNQRDSLRQEPNINQNESHNLNDSKTLDSNTNTSSDQRDSLRQEHNINQNESHNLNDSKTLDSNTNTSSEGRAPTKGTAGVMESNFGADHTTTSTFEKSQGEKYGEGFDETGAQLKGRFSVSEPSRSGAAGASGSDKHASQQHKGHETDAHKEGFAHKLKDKAEGRQFLHTKFKNNRLTSYTTTSTGIFHPHHDNKAESRTEAH